jgi:hypothetical protein
MRRPPRPTASLALRLAPFCLAALPGCGGGGGPTAPPPAPPVVTGLDFSVTPMVNQGTVVAFQWSGSGASSYRVEIGTTSGASDVGTFEASTASFKWTGVPVGNFYARVRGLQGATVGLPCADVLVSSIDARHVIDALIFGFGPLAVAGNAAGPFVQDHMEGWQPGTGFEVILGESVPANLTASVQKTVQQVGPATKGAVTAGIVGRRPDPLPSPGPGEVTVSLVSPQEVNEECRCDNCVGCATQWLRGSFITRGRILVSAEAQPSAAAHELGHIIGLGHVISPTGLRPPFTMGVTTDGKFSPRGQSDVLDPATTQMLETLYGMGLTAGASRRQFEAAGLVPAEYPAAASSARSEHPRPAHVLRREGLETVIVKPLCPWSVEGSTRRSEPTPWAPGWRQPAGRSRRASPRPPGSPSGSSLRAPRPLCGRSPGRGPSPFASS